MIHLNALSGHRQQGFTLIEVLIAVSILALVMVTLGQTLGASGCLRQVGGNAGLPAVAVYR